MSARISDKILQVAESATLKVDAKAKALQAAGRPVISFAAGEPDFATPPAVVAAADKALQDPKNFRYTAAPGLPELRKAIAEKTLRDSGLEVDIDQIVVTNGGKQAVYEAFQAIIDEGDEVLVPTPYWTSYPEIIKLAGGRQVDVFAGADADYLVTVEQLEAAWSPRVKALLFVSPSNPTGAVYDYEQTKAIGEWALSKGIWVISDEIYQNLVYDGSDHAVSILQAVPELAERTILVNGVAKSYAMTGWRVGWLVGPKDAAKAAVTLQSHLSSNVNNIAQLAALEALSGDQKPVLEFRDAFNRRRELIVTELSKIPGMKVPNPKGAFYVYPDVTGLLDREWDGVYVNSSLELADLILEKCEVAAVPGEAFGPSGFLRFAYALSDEEIIEGVSRLQKFFAE